MFRLLLVTVLAATTLAQETQEGICDGSVKTLPVRNLSTFAGAPWYLVHSLQPWDGGQCPTLIGTPHPSTPTDVMIANRLFVWEDKIYNITRSIVKSPYGITQSTQAYLPTESDIAEFAVLDTDGVTYSAVYTCLQDYSTNKTVIVSVYSPLKTLPPKAIKKLEATKQMYKELRNGHWKTHDHSNCPF